jgi:phosphatidylserine/phosphatidylglycerophosphate/cardiolipin synthase-like enzyme
LATPKPSDYFLPPHADPDPGLVLAPTREGRGLQTIIDGDAIFVALEEAVAGATKSVLIAFWALELTLPLKSKAALAGGKKIWLELLASAAKSGARVCVLLSDFDPFFFNLGAAHFGAWFDYRALVNVAVSQKLPNLQVVCSRHPAEIPASSVGLVGDIGKLYSDFATLLNNLDEPARITRFANSPGLWQVYDLKPDNTVAVKKKDDVFPIFPGSHHQKLVVVDGQVAFAGGINLIARNRDSQKHALDPLPWHDAFLRVEGEPVGDIRDNFIGRWNEGRKACEAFLKAANAATGGAGSMPIGATDALDAKSIPLAAPDTKKPSFPCQVHRTISRLPCSFRGVPTLVRDDVLKGYLTAIGLAEAFIYIENQYLREQAIADAIVAQHKKQKGLRTLIVLPDVAEELLAGKGDPLTNVGAFLQHDALEAMKKAIGANLGLFTMKRPKDAKLVYVHAKVLIVDDVYANLGSANANPRSFRMDTELNLAWHDPTTVRQFRTALWKEQLGSPAGMSSWLPADFVKQWSKIAAKNARAPKSPRTSYVFPFDNRAKGTANPLIPEEFT